jgi:uncharacterized protein (TIGR02996 family)
MSDHDALLRAVCEQPDDDTPRLVYADWLDEHAAGDADRARAEFIRLEIEYQSSVYEYGHPRLAEIAPRLEELVKPHWREWTAPLLAIPRVKWWGELAWPGGYDRGFIDHVEFPSARSFAQQAARVFSLTPAGCVRFNRLSPRTAHVLGLPHMGTVRELDLGRGRREYPGHYETPPSNIGLRGAAALASNPTLTRLETLRLAGGIIGDDGAAALAAAADAGRFPRLNRPTLSELDLTVNGLTAAGLSVLLRSRLLEQVKRLRLCGNPLYDAGAAVLAAAPLPASLWELDLNQTGITDAGVRLIAAAPLSERLQVLCLIENGLTDDAAEALAAAGHHTHLNHLYLGYNHITARGAERLAEWCSAHRGATIDLRGNPITAAELAALRPLFGDASVQF